MKDKEEISCLMPFSVDTQNLNVFRNKSTYTLSKLKIRELNNVFVSHEGICLKNFKLVSKSHFNLKGNQDRTFYFDFWKIGVEQFLVSSFGKSLTKKVLDGDKYLLVHGKWFGYFFWLTDCLPKLIKSREYHSTAKLIYPEGWKSIRYVNESLSLFSELECELIPSGVHMSVKKLLLPETRQWSNAIDPSEVNLVRDYVFEKLHDQGIHLNLGEKIFISRAKANRRKFKNDTEVERVFASNGYKSVCMENYSFLEQISIMKGARFVAGMHGAGLANSLFMKENGHLIELSPKIDRPKDFRIPFWRLANAVNARYYLFFGENMGDCNPYDDDVSMDINALHSFLASI